MLSNPGDRNPARIAKADKDFAEKLEFKDIKYPVKVREIHKIEKTIPVTLVFLVPKRRKNIQFMYQKYIVKKNMLIYY